MRTRAATVRLTVPLVVAALVLAGCSAGDSGPVGAGSVGAVNDINPKDPAQLRDGGNLRLAISAFPANWNTLSNDGNDAEIANVVWPMMPRAFAIDPAGKPVLNTDYFTSVELTGTAPQQVTYTINPKAVWSDGNPITWEDIRSEWQALAQRDKRYLIAISNGFDRVEKVERGVDDRQAVITFRQPYAEWRGQFAGNAMLYPKSVTSSPEAFNNGLVNSITLTAGPFTIVSADRTQGRFVLGRNPRWWGAKPKLDTITYSVLDNAAQLPALQNNELDAIELSTIDQVKTARGASGITIRRAPGFRFSHLTFNGSPGSIMADPKLRLAISKAIDRKGIATAIYNGMVAQPKPLNNHVFVEGQDGYRDNSGPEAYDPVAAAKELDALGWQQNGDVRRKDGRKLVIRDVFYQTETWVKIAQIIQQNLARVGVQLTIDPRPGQDYFTKVIQPGDFDVAQFSWVGDPFPLSGIPQIYTYHPDDLQGNYGRIGTPELNELIDKAVSEIDPVKTIDLANQVDRAVFAEGFSLPLMQWPGNYGTRASLANYGAPGLASYDYTKIGFLK